MSRLYYKSADDWQFRALRPGVALVTAPDPEDPLAEIPYHGPPAGASPAARFLRLAPAGDAPEADVLVAPPESRARVNGRPVIGGLKVLHGRCAVRVGGMDFVYCDEDPVRVETFVPGEDPTFCPRCSGLVEGGDAVRCRCGTWYHQSAEKPCFTYGETCVICNCRTALDEEAWTPELL